MKPAVRLGWPGWRVLAGLGLPVSIRVEIAQDEETGMYCARSPDLAGLILEAATLDELVHEIQVAAAELLEARYGRNAPRTDPTLIMRGAVPCGA